MSEVSALKNKNRCEVLTREAVWILVFFKHFFLFHPFLVLLSNCFILLGRSAKVKRYSLPLRGVTGFCLAYLSAVHVAVNSQQTTQAVMIYTCISDQGSTEGKLSLPQGWISFLLTLNKFSGAAMSSPSSIYISTGLITAIHSLTFSLCSCCFSWIFVRPIFSAVHRSLNSSLFTADSSDYQLVAWPSATIGTWLTVKYIKALLNQFLWLYN